MRTVTHLVVTENFAGTERYVCQLANASVQRGWRVTVIGGDPTRMQAELLPGVHWLPGATAVRAAWSLCRLGRQDVCHAHLTLAEIVAAALRRRHRARVISTRHIAAPRGASRLGRLVAPWVSRSLDQEIAISRFVSERIGSERNGSERIGSRPAAVTIHNGVPESESHWDAASRVVLLVQRLEPEKQTALALRAWQVSALAPAGWRLRIVGDGSQRHELEALVVRDAIENVEFLGRRADVARQLATAGIFFAGADQEPLGLSVLEAMAAGIPVVASKGGGHEETLAPVIGVNGFPPGDVAAAAACLTRLGTDADLRRQLSELGRARQLSIFTLSRMVEQIHLQYTGQIANGPGPR